MLVSITAGPLRDRIVEWPDDDADLWQVWEIPPMESMLPSSDITKQFAETWAKEFGAKPLPAFIAAHLEELPNPLRKRA
jgi:hypothetical protein